MKIYTYDGGWRGAIAIIADDKEEAFEIAQKEGVLCMPENSDKFEEHEFSKGIIVDCVGDQ